MGGWEIGVRLVRDRVDGWELGVSGEWVGDSGGVGGR